MKKNITFLLLTLSLFSVLLLHVGCRGNTPEDETTPTPTMSITPSITSTLTASTLPLPTVTPVSLTGEIDISDVYCNYGDTQSFPFRFTLKNLTGEDMEIEYTWSLNDPMSGRPKYEGQGNLSLPALTDQEIEINIQKENHADPRVYVMHVNVYNDEIELAVYSQCKLMNDWDYSVLPPVLWEQKPQSTTVWIDTLVKKASEGYQILINDIVCLPPEETPELNLNNIAILFEGYTDYLFLLEDLIDYNPEAPLSVRFHDADSNGEVSEGDYLTTDDQAKGAEFELKSRENSSIRIQGIGPSHEYIFEENPEAIHINYVNYHLNDDQILDIEVEVTHSNPLSGDLKMIQPNPGYRESGICSLETIAITQGNTSLYRTTFDYAAFKQAATLSGFTGSWNLYIILSDRVIGETYINRVNETFYFVCELP